MGPVAVAHGQITPRLVTRLLNDVGDDLDQLPILQHALMRTWDEWRRSSEPDSAMDLEHYERVGGMRNALSLHAEEAYAEAITETSADVVSTVFKALTDTTSDVHGIRRPTSIDNLAAICQVKQATIETVVETFRRPGRSFLMPPASVALDGQSVIDISHESLMRCWTRLLAWTEEERASAQMYRRIAQASIWFTHGTGGLWRDPELELGLQWRAQNHPTIAWALQYDTHFDEALDFLNRSELAREQFLGPGVRFEHRKRQDRMAHVMGRTQLCVHGSRFSVNACRLVPRTLTPRIPLHLRTRPGTLTGAGWSTCGRESAHIH